MWAINKGQNIHCCIADELKILCYSWRSMAEDNLFQPKATFQEW